jgi:hypothetical protein
MERRRLQQQRMKQQQQRFCVSQQDLTQAIARMKPQRRATHANLLIVPSLSSCSIETLTIPSVSQLIKEFEARTVSTPYINTQDFPPNNNVIVSNDCFPQIFVQTMNVNVDKNEQFTGDKEQIHQTSDNDRYKRDLSSSSSFYSTEGSNNTTQMFTRNTDQGFSEIRAKETQLNNALADLISLSNDGDISSSVSSSLRSLTNHSQHRRASSINNDTNSIAASIALLNNLLETFDLDMEEYRSKTNTIVRSSPQNEDVKPINMFW